MKQFLVLLTLAVFSVVSLTAQKTTALNFVRTDCNGNQHDLFAELDSGNCVILEYFMTCSSCINAAKKIQSMMTRFEKQIPGKLKFYMLGYTNSYSCATAKNFVATNGFNATPFDSGATQVAYYGGFGMPTVVVVGGKDHKVLFTDIGFSNSDTTEMANAITELYGLSNVDDAEIEGLRISPQPVANIVTITSANGGLDASSLRLFDTHGQALALEPSMLTRADGEAISINTTTLTAGMYVIRFRIAGRECARSIIVQH